MLLNEQRFNGDRRAQTLVCDQQENISLKRKFMKVLQISELELVAFKLKFTMLL